MLLAHDSMICIAAKLTKAQVERGGHPNAELEDGDEEMVPKMARAPSVSLILFCPPYLTIKLLHPRACVRSKKAEAPCET